MPNLSKLVVCTGESYHDSESLLPLVNLIGASPRLQRFVVEVINLFGAIANSFLKSSEIVKRYIYIIECTKILL